MESLLTCASVGGRQRQPGHAPRQLSPHHFASPSLLRKAGQPQPFGEALRSRLHAFAPPTAGLLAPSADGQVGTQALDVRQMRDGLFLPSVQRVDRRHSEPRIGEARASRCRLAKALVGLGVASELELGQA